MAICLEESGHLAILVYFTIFGLALLSSSSVFLVNLNEVDTSHCEHGILVHTETASDLTVDCAHIEDWKFFATVGIVYGVISILTALSKLIPVLWRACCNREVGEVTTKPSIARATLRRAAGGSALTKAAHHFVNLQRRENESRDFWLHCGKFLKICVHFTFIISLWLSSLIIPVYLSVSLIRTGAIRADRQEDILYFPALTLFAICVISLTVVVVAGVSIFMESMDEDNSSSEGDREDEVERITYTGQGQRGTTGTVYIETTTTTTEASFEGTA